MALQKVEAELGTDSQRAAVLVRLLVLLVLLLLIVLCLSVVEYEFLLMLDFHVDVDKFVVFVLLDGGVRVDLGDENY